MKTMKSTLSLTLFLACTLALSAQVTLRYDRNETLTYDEIIRAYQEMATRYPEATLLEAGTTDVGKPLHLFILSRTGLTTPEEAASAGLPVIFINNGIHPGEPEGIDASIQLVMDILGNKDGMKAYLDKVISLEHIFRLLNPLVFLDTHTTNGSDHQYTLTLIPTMYQKMEPAMGRFFHETMVPALFDYMKHTPYEMIPYVASVHGTPDKGIAAFNDLPRFSTGYAALFNTFAFMTENHVYKPFRDRVRSVYLFMKGLTDFTARNGTKMLQLKKEAEAATARQKEFVLTWRLDTTKYRMIPFKGYELRQYTGAVTGLPYYWYDRQKPYTKEIRYYDTFLPVKQVTAPRYYIIPQAWQEAVRRLQINRITMYRLATDTTVTLQVPYITSLDKGTRPYNGPARQQIPGADPRAGCPGRFLCLELLRSRPRPPRVFLPQHLRGKGGRSAEERPAAEKSLRRKTKERQRFRRQPLPAAQLHLHPLPLARRLLDAGAGVSPG